MGSTKKKVQSELPDKPSNYNSVLLRWCHPIHIHAGKLPDANRVNVELRVEDRTFDPDMVSAGTMDDFTVTSLELLAHLLKKLQRVTEKL